MKTDQNIIPPYEPCSDEMTVGDFLSGMGVKRERDIIRVKPPEFVFIIFNQEVLKAFLQN